MKRVQISHDIVQLVIVRYRARAHPVTLVVFFQVTEKFFHCFPGSFPRLRIFKIDVSISFTDLLQAVVKNDNMADCFSCSAW